MENELRVSGSHSHSGWLLFMKKKKIIIKCLNSALEEQELNENFIKFPLKFISNETRDEVDDSFYF